MKIRFLISALSAFFPFEVCLSSSDHNWDPNFPHNWEENSPYNFHPSSSHDFQPSYFNGQHHNSQENKQPILRSHGDTDVLFWYGGRLFFIDPRVHKLCAYNTLTTELFCATIGLEDLSFAVLVEGAEDKFVVGADKQIILITWHPSRDEEIKSWTQIATVDGHIPGNRVNYGTVDLIGKLMFGTMNTRGEHYGSIYTLSRIPHSLRHISGISSSSGFTFGKSVYPPKFYFIDAAHDYNVISYNFQSQNGRIAGVPSIVYKWSELHPNENPRRLTIDTDGKLWIPIYGGGKVIRVDPHTRSILQTIDVPASRVSACTFGGPGMDILYVSTMVSGEANQRASPQDLSGSIFAYERLGVRGWKPNLYKLKIADVERKGFKPLSI